MALFFVSIFHFFFVLFLRSLLCHCIIIISLFMSVTVSAEGILLFSFIYLTSDEQLGYPLPQILSHRRPWACDLLGENAQNGTVGLLAHAQWVPASSPKAHPAWLSICPPTGRAACSCIPNSLHLEVCPSLPNLSCWQRLIVFICSDLNTNEVDLFFLWALANSLLFIFEFPVFFEPSIFLGLPFSYWFV